MASGDGFPILYPYPEQDDPPPENGNGDPGIPGYYADGSAYSRAARRWWAVHLLLNIVLPIGLGTAILISGLRERRRDK